MNLNNNSLPNLLSHIYPDYGWLPWKFAKVPKLFWNSMTNQRKFMDWAGKQLGVKEMNDWYKIKYNVIVINKSNLCIFCKDFIQVGGKSMMDKYNFSLANAIAAVYSEHEWLPWRFQGSATALNKNAFMDYVRKELDVKEMQDWYKVKEEVKIKRERGVDCFYSN